jgi:tetratricopeptide (TPR) repeat protein
MTDSTTTVLNRGAEEIGTLLHVAAGLILKHEEPGPLLEWAEKYAPDVAPTFFAMAPEAPARIALARLIGRAIWNATPLPSNGFRPRPLPEPGRNDPCFCGSPRKYKHCCGAVGRPPLPLAPETMLMEILDQWPASRFGEIPRERLSPEVLGHVAGEWLEQGQAERARKLLEPLFTDIERLDARAESAFDVLADVYLALGQPKKKAALIERVANARAPELRVAAMQRQCTVLFDAGRRDEAWRLFQQAQRQCPDHPAFSHLEAVMLLSEGRLPEAVERAKFWAARLAREDAEGYRDGIAFLREIAADPHAAMMKISSNRTPGLARLQGLIVAATPPAKTLYEMARDPEGRAALAPAKTARSLWQRWNKVFPPLSASLTDVIPEGPYVWEDETAERWLAFLERTPQAFGVIEILDGLVFALRQLPDNGLAWVNQQVATPLVAHAVRVFDQALEAHEARAAEVPWVIWGNRPALRLFVNLIYLHLDRDDDEAALPLLERMIYTLNPNDNHGLRELLSRVYLKLGQPEKALTLAARYPDDHMASLMWNRVLALHRLGRLDEAAAALKAARRDLPDVYKFLCAEKIAQPRLTPGYVTYRGRDEAWYYREAHLELWREGGALEWLRRSGKKATATA